MRWEVPCGGREEGESIAGSFAIRRESLERTCDPNFHTRGGRSASGAATLMVDSASKLNPGNNFQYQLRKPLTSTFRVIHPFSGDFPPTIEDTRRADNPRDFSTSMTGTSVVAQRSGRPLETDPAKFPSLSPAARTFVIEINRRLEAAGLSYKSVFDQQMSTSSLDSKWISTAMRSPTGVGEYVYNAILKTLAQHSYEAAGSSVAEVELQLHRELDHLYMSAYQAKGHELVAPAPPSPVVDDQLTARLLDWLWGERDVTDERFIEVLDAHIAALPASLVQIIERDRFAVAGFLEKVAELRGRDHTTALLGAIKSIDADAAAVIVSLVRLPEPEAEIVGSGSILELDPAIGVARRRAALLARKAYEQVIREILVLLADDPGSTNPADEAGREENITHSRPTCPTLVTETLHHIAESGPEGPLLVAELLNKLDRAGEKNAVNRCVTALFDLDHADATTGYAPSIITNLTDNLLRNVVTVICVESRLHDHEGGSRSLTDIRTVIRLLDYRRCLALANAVVAEPSPTLALGHFAKLLLDERRHLVLGLMRSSALGWANLIGRVLADQDGCTAPGTPDDFGIVSSLVTSFISSPTDVTRPVWDRLLTHHPAEAALFIYHVLNSKQGNIVAFMGPELGSSRRLRGFASLIDSASADLAFLIFAKINDDLSFLARPLNTVLVTRHHDRSIAIIREGLSASPKSAKMLLTAFASVDNTGPWSFALDRFASGGPSAAQAVCWPTQA